MRRWSREPSRDLAGQVAVVTGASSGFGRRLCGDLAVAGCRVVGIARREHLLAELNQEMDAAGSGCSTRTCDVADREALQRHLGEIEGAAGSVDILVNNAGTEALTPLAAGMTPDYERMIDVNYLAAVAGTLAVLPGMIRRGRGVVVNVASDSARAPEPGHGAYAASKSAVAAFTESVAHEAAAHGVRIHVLYPAWMPTAMGFSGLEDGGGLPPKIVRRTEAEVSSLVMATMGSSRLEINASRVPLLAPMVKTLTPPLYRWAIRRRSG